MSYCNCGLTGVDLIYHDTEWGIPVHNDRKQFEYLMLEVMQCGLNWHLVLLKREVFRRCFDGFDYERIARYTAKDVQRILNTPHMLQSPRKINAVIQNARAFCRLRKEEGSFSRYLWAYTDGKTLLYTHHEKGFLPASNALSLCISRDLKSRGFTYLGPVTVYSHLQACGIINDHTEDCSRYHYINRRYPTLRARRTQEN